MMGVNHWASAQKSSGISMEGVHRGSAGTLQQLVVPDSASASWRPLRWQRSRGTMVPPTPAMVPSSTLLQQRERSLLKSRDHWMGQGVIVH